MDDLADAAKRRVLTLFAELEAEGIRIGGHWSGGLIINAQHRDDGGDGSHAEIDYCGDDSQRFGSAAGELAAMGEP